MLLSNICDEMLHIGKEPAQMEAVRRRVVDIQREGKGESSTAVLGVSSPHDDWSQIATLVKNMHVEGTVVNPGQTGKVEGVGRKIPKLKSAQL